MGLAALFAVPIFQKQVFQKWVRYFFLIHALVTSLIAFVYFYPNFSDKLLLIGIPWGITAPVSMLLLAIMFRKDTDLKNQAKKGKNKLNQYIVPGKSTLNISGIAVI